MADWESAGCNAFRNGKELWRQFYGQTVVLKLSRTGSSGGQEVNQTFCEVKALLDNFPLLC